MHALTHRAIAEWTTVPLAVPINLVLNASPPETLRITRETTYVELRDFLGRSEKRSDLRGELKIWKIVCDEVDRIARQVNESGKKDGAS